VYSERALIISGSDKGLDGVASFLKASGCRTVVTIFSGSEARRTIQYNDYELIIINTPLKDEFGHQLALKLSETTCSGIILICKADMAEEMGNRTIDYGISVISKPLNKNLFLQAIRTSIGFHQRLFTLHRENHKLRTKLEETRYISQAKFLLIVNQDMSEESAHRYIEKTAMDTRRTRKEVAQEIIDKYK